MRKLLIFMLTSILSLGVGWAETTETITFSNTSDTGTYCSFTSGRNGGSTDPQINSSQLRLYNGCYITISSTTKKLKSITFTATFNQGGSKTKYTPSWSDFTLYNSLTGNFNTTTAVWTAADENTTSVSLQNSSGKAGNIGLTKMVITYVDSDEPTTNCELTLPTGLTGGTVSASVAEDLTAIPSGTSITVTATPDTENHYALDWMKANNVAVNNPYTFNITENTEITAAFKQLTVRTITVTGGTTDKASAYEGETVTVTPTIPSGKVVDNYTVTPATTTLTMSGNNYTFTMPDENVTIEFTFKDKPNYVFYESFDTNNGTGGNDDKWSDNIASSTLKTDNEDWICEKGNGANKCAKFGGGSAQGSATTPSISVKNGSVYKLTFKAAAWNGKSEITTLNISATGATLYSDENCTTSVSSETLTKGAWIDYVVYVKASSTTITITWKANQASNNRFFLDEVKLVEQVVEEKNYDVTVVQPDAGGTITANPSGEKIADEGDEITLTATPDGNYVFGEWNVYKTGDENTKVTVTDNKFTMPGYSVTINATFNRVIQTVTVPDTYTEAFTSGFGKFYVNDVVATTGDVWTIGNNNGDYFAKGTSFLDKQNTAAESWLTSPYIDLTSATNPKVSFKHSIDKFFGTVANEATVWVKEKNAETWTQLVISTYPTVSGTMSSFEDVEFDLSTYAGKTIQVAFKYIGTTTTAGTWEIQNFKVENIVPAVKYAINIDSNITNGTVTTNPADEAEESETVTVTATPAEGYLLKSISVVDEENNTVELTDNTFTMPAAAVTVSAVFTARPIYTVTVNPSTNGSVTATPTEGYEGQEINLTVTPAEGYRLNSLSVKDAANNDVALTGNTFTMPASNVTVSATFEEKPIITGAEYTLVTSTSEIDTNSEYVLVTGDATNIASYYDNGYVRPATEGFVVDGNTVTIANDTKAFTFKLVAASGDNAYYLKLDNKNTQGNYFNVGKNEIIVDDYQGTHENLVVNYMTIGDNNEVILTHSDGYKYVWYTTTSDGIYFNCGEIDKMNVEKIKTLKLYKRPLAEVPRIKTVVVPAEGGSIVLDSDIDPMTVTANTEVLFTLKANQGYEFVSLTAVDEHNTTVIYEEPDLTESAPIGSIYMPYDGQNVTITLTLQKALQLTFVNTHEEGGEWIVSADNVYITNSPSNVKANQTIEFVVNVNEGYKFLGFEITKTEDGSAIDVTDYAGSIAANGSGKFLMPEFDVTITARYAKGLSLLDFYLEDDKEGKEYFINEDLTVMAVMDDVISDRVGYRYHSGLMLKDADGKAWEFFKSEPMTYVVDP